MKLTKHRLKQLISEELDLMAETNGEGSQLREGGYAGHYERSESDPATELDDLIELSGRAIKDAIAKIEEAQSLLAALTEEPHKVGAFVALRTRARMVDNALEDLLERYTIAVGEALRWREEE